MSDGSWTPGPWKVIEEPVPTEVGVRYDIEASDGGDLVDVGFSFSEPDARLIAAAPEMAELLDTWCEGQHDRNWCRLHDVSIASDFHERGCLVDDTLNLLARVRGEA